jgi:uncharacterized membrane protein (UPF0127 family)
VRLRVLSLRAPLLALLVAFLGWLPVGATAAGLRTEPISLTTAKGTYHFRVEVADTEASRARGLMFRKSIAPDSGMLFDFKTPQEVAFWMKNTLVPLDMLFVAANGRVLSVARNAPPLSETPIPSGGEVLFVIEIAGGRAAQIGAEPGDRVLAAGLPP